MRRDKFEQAIDQQLDFDDIDISIIHRNE